jgi:hypothetical protein
VFACKANVMLCNLTATHYIANVTRYIVNATGYIAIATQYIAIATGCDRVVGHLFPLVVDRSLSFFKLKAAITTALQNNISDRASSTVLPCTCFKHHLDAIARSEPAQNLGVTLSIGVFEKPNDLIEYIAEGDRTASSDRFADSSTDQ